ncbi:GntR family transcriptional regulator [Actinoplanes friuliensis]|uniref:GntR family transcriptional regulator n=1 Tax=Actinoplanes friuliensis TaxID=196914 RepID=UPI00069495D5
MGEVTARVEVAIRGLVTSGEYGPQDKLPSERRLAEDLGAGRTTVRLVLTMVAEPTRARVQAAIAELGYVR